MKKLSAQQVAAYFESLTPEEMKGNPAVSAAGRAFTRLQQTHAAGPGRPPTVEHRNDLQRPRNWGRMSQSERSLWARENGALCRCANCRRKHLPSYQHAAYAGRSEA